MRAPEKAIKHRSHARNYHDLPYSETNQTQILQDIFASRGEDFATANDYGLKHLLRPDNLLGLSEAVALLYQHLTQQKRMLIVGDFDADGATSTAVAIRCLSAFGARYVDYLVPNRFVYGYGLTPEIVDVALDKKPDLIITVDNGISSVEGVAAAKKHGIKVLVTDHHLPGKTLPEADAIVNPNQPGCEFPSKNLAGVGVIFYLLSALRAELRKNNWFAEQNIPEFNMAHVLDIVALGTVADVVPLDYNNRILVAAGIKRMREERACAGIKALLHIAKREAVHLTSSDLGFALGPRLNAAGRLDDMSLGIQCLLSDDFYQAQQWAQTLDELNQDRKLIESSMQSEANKQFAQLSEAELEAHAGICLYQKDWHQGVIGILASRIKDRLHRPTIIFADADNGELKGSGRSIPGVHLRDVLDEVASSNPGLINKFGGHAMAAGLSIQPDTLESFKDAFDQTMRTHLTGELREPVVYSDGELPEHWLTLPFAHALSAQGPWGQHFPEPIFHGTFQIVNQRIVGEKHLKLTLAREVYSNLVFDAIAFNVDTQQWPNPEAREVRIAYQLDVNRFRGEERLQLLVSTLVAV